MLIYININKTINFGPFKLVKSNALQSFIKIYPFDNVRDDI